MIRYIIALQELGLKNNNLISLLQEQPNIIKSMFDADDKTFFENNFELLSFSGIFSNKHNVLKALSTADDILRQNEIHGIKTAYYTGTNYPIELANITNPPAVIYYMGAEFNTISQNSIACVGTRKPTKLSYNAVNYLIPQWVTEGCSIISGLAHGVDKLAHQSCITSGGKTIAVLAHGLDLIYPKDNSPLANKILASGGILMSEYPIGTKPDKFRFVKRNRLIVGMSKAVVIFECDVNGGTMHNIEHAQKQHKPIFSPALGSEITEIQTGTKYLIDNNISIVIKEGRDILSVLNSVGASITKPRMHNNQIKTIYLKSLLSIIENPIVLTMTLNDLHLDNLASDNIFNYFIELTNHGIINIDMIIQSLINNNISYIQNNNSYND